VWHVSGRRLRGAAVAGTAFVLLTAYAQVALGRHYPSDLLAGWLLSLAVVAGTAAVRQGGPDPSSHTAP
jgi:membrane-associated phospholipid phosphatase